VTHRAPADEGFGKRLHPDRRHHPRLESGLLQHILHREGVYHSAEHSHIVGADTVHTHLRELRAADDVATADHQSDRGTQLDDVGDLGCEAVHDIEVEADTLVSGESLA
jgi:hypothetical protein